MLVFGSKLFDFDLNSNSLFKEHTVQGSDIMFDSLFNLDVSSLHDCLWYAELFNSCLRSETHFAEQSALYFHTYYQYIGELNE